jgi:hypothetical protein
VKTPREVAHDIAKWLAAQVAEGSFPARTFYGEAFAIWLWSFFPNEFPQQIEALLPRALEQLRRADVEAHPEFNLLALLGYCQAQSLEPEDVIGSFPGLREAPSCNWLLLGTLLRLRWNHVAGGKRFSEALLRMRTRLLILFQQRSDGLIRDDRLLDRRLPLPFPFARVGRLGVRYDARLRGLSLQYHCFSLALLIDIYAVAGWPEVGRAIERGVAAICRFVLDNGDTLYLGRGQQQIFGYGALLYALAAASRCVRVQGLAKTWHDVWRFVASHQRDDGSFPLVLRSGEQGYPQKVDTSDLRWLGWYSYNNYFDYLPLLGVYLARTWDSPVAERPRGAPVCAGEVGQQLVVNRHYAVIRESGWQAVLATPGGPRSQDQPVPYLCLGGRSVLPCFGGEEYSPSSYNLSMLPLPYAVRSSGEPACLREMMRWSLRRGARARTLVLRGTCRWARFQRHYEWGAHEFSIRDSLRLSTPPFEPSEVRPLVFAACELHRRRDGSYGIHEGLPSLRLRIAGVEGILGIEAGTSPMGATRVLTERVPWDGGRGRVFERTMRLSWGEQKG